MTGEVLGPDLRGLRAARMRRLLREWRPAIGPATERVEHPWSRIHV
jgi:hypothetical protein